MKSSLSSLLKFSIFTVVLFSIMWTTALADVEGGNGYIVGIDNTKEYLISSLTMSEDGDLLRWDEVVWTLLDDSTNTNLSGLYYIKDSSATESNIVYVNGKIDDKRSLGVADNVVSTTSFGDGLWEVGSWTGAELNGTSVKSGEYYSFYHDSGHGIEAFGTSTLSSLPSSTKVTSLPDITDKTDEE